MLISRFLDLNQETAQCSLCRESPRSTDLKKLADAWQPLYQRLSPEQKRRMGYLAMYVMREMRTNAE